MTFRPAIALTALILPAMLSSAAQATVFSLDEFFIEKGTTSTSRTEIFRDSFNDGALPASGPDGASTYIVTGGGFFSENAGTGRLLIDPSLGNPSFVGPGLFSRIRRAASTAPGAADTLDAASSWTANAIFDLASVPQVGESVGLRVEDFGSTTFANDRLNLRLGRDSGGALEVAFSAFSFNSVSFELFDSVALQPLLDSFTSADQILLSMFNDENSSVVGAEFSLLAGGSSVYSQVFDNIGDTTGLAAAVFSDEGFTRAAITASGLSVEVPEPGALAFLGLGLAALVRVRRRRAR